MKKVLLTTLAVSGIALGAFAQGSFAVNNGSANNGVTLNTAGAYYDGTIGFQIWYLNGTTFNLANFNALANVDAYAALTTGGFTLATTRTSYAMIGGGFSGLPDLQMPGVTPAGSTVTLAVAAWQGTATSWANATVGGVVAYYQPTANYQISPAPTAPDMAGNGSTTGWNNQDLVMKTIAVVPEPSTFALAGLGAAAMMIFRRRK